MIVQTVIALFAGIFMPLRWGVWGFLAAAALIFAGGVGYGVATGFEGASIEESLLLFNGSWPSYIGFHLLVTYRAFALPLLALAVPLIVRMGRA